jgi:hypothetical protein
MSWPMRASLLRADTVADRIDGWLIHGDPPYLGGIAASCQSLRAVESRGHVLQITAPPRLAGSHARLIRAYVAVRAGCAQARLAALAARTALDRAFTTQSASDRHASDHATAVARRDLQRFNHGALRTFPQTVNRWRLAVVAYETTLGMAPPAWLTQLSP